MRFYIREILFVLAFMVLTGVYGQTDPPVRIELDVKSDEASFRIVPCGHSGFLLFYETAISEEENKYWAVIRYDPQMQEIWKTEVPLHKQVNYASDLFSAPYAYLLFHAPDRKKATFNYHIVKIDIISGSTEVFGGNIPDKAAIKDFRVSDEAVFIAYNYEKSSGVHMHNTVTRAQQPVFFNDSVASEMECLYIDPLNGNVWGIFNNYFSKSEYALFVVEFDLKGGFFSQYRLTSSEGRKLNAARMIILENRTILVLGTYDNLKSKSPDLRNYFSNESTGYFLTSIENGQVNPAKYYNFLEFENITGYLKAGEFLAAKKKAAKKGTENLSLEYDLLIHDIYEHNGLLYFVAEGYYDEYHTVTSTYYDYYGRPTPLSYSVFDGYRYFNTFIACFDSLGNKVWDNGLEIFNILTFHLKRMVKVYFDGEDAILAYNRDGKVAYKIISGGHSVKGAESFPLESSYLNDRVIQDSKSRMDHWYDNYFLCYGFQTIRNTSFRDKEKRTVFYLNMAGFR